MPAAAAPQSAPTVAVYDFSDADKNSDGFGNKVTSLVTAAIDGDAAGAAQAVDDYWGTGLATVVDEFAATEGKIA